MTASTLLAVEGLTKRFRHAEPVIQGVNMEVREGEAVALLGSNGSGKSTLLRCCLKLIGQDSGTIRLFGEDLKNLRGRRLRSVRSRVGFVFQNHNLVPRISVLSNVLHGALHRIGFIRGWTHALSPDMHRREALHCLERVGLAHLADRRTDGLSGGQAQRVAIARALMQRPRMVLADEPVASLDPLSAREVMDLFAALCREENIALLFTSHAPEQALHYSDRVIGLKHGSIVLNGSSRELTPEHLHRIYD